MRNKWSLEVILISLVLITILAIVTREKILKTSLIITPESHPQTHLYTDMLSGGNSFAQKTKPDQFEWVCTLKDQFAYPYCGFEVYLGKDRTEGISLENYETVDLWLDYTGDSETLRIYLREFDPVYSIKGIEKSTKYNQVEFPVSQLENQPVRFSLHDFFVANWWLVELKIKPEMSHPQFDNIVFIEVHTGSQTKLGEHHFHLKKIELKGQIISTEKWYLLIMSIWMTGLVTFVIYRIVYLGKQVSLQKKRELELLEINNLLDLRSKEFEEKSKTDSLTGVFNRTGIEEAMLVGLTEWRQQKKPLSLILIDIDHFKKINDLHGHVTGDQVLSTLSQLIKDHIRLNDLFARWGGEEFVLFCRNTNTDQTFIIAEKVRELIANHPFPNQLQVTASMGVATLQTNESLESLFNRADAALYKAKENGRNRTELAT